MHYHELVLSLVADRHIQLFLDQCLECPIEFANIPEDLPD